MEENKYNIRLSESEEIRKIVKSFMFKPVLAIWTMFALGLVLLLTPLWPLGIVILLLVTVVLFFIPNRKVMDIYDEGILIYNRNDADLAQDIRFDNIKEWKIQTGKSSSILLILWLENDDYAYSEVNSGSKLVRILNNIIPEKEANYMRLKEMEKLKTPFTFDIFKGKTKK